MKIVAFPNFERVVSLSAILVATLLFSGSAQAADALEQLSVEERLLQPAVSDVNAKLETSIVHFDLEEGDGKGYLLQGAVSVPIGQTFGFQFDAGTLNGELENDDLFAHGVGGHFFWRDPSVGLLGAYGHHVWYENGVSVSRFGGELEWYSGQLTIEAFAGVDHLNTPIGDESFASGEVEIAWYATDNFRLSAGVSHSFEQTSALFGAEAMMDSGDFAPSIYANAKVGDDDTTLLAGVRLYLGQSKSLKRRHREDDPAIGLFEQFGAMTNCLSNGDEGTGVVTNFGQRNARVYIPPSSPTYELDGCGVKLKN